MLSITTPTLYHAIRDPVFHIIHLGALSETRNEPNRCVQSPIKAHQSAAESSFGKAHLPSQARSSSALTSLQLTNSLTGAPSTDPLRALSGNMFSQQNNANRGPPLSSSRLQNGKLGMKEARHTRRDHTTQKNVGNNSSWFGMGAGGAPGLSNPQSRSGAAFSTFASTLGGGPQQPSLDPS